MDMYLLDAYERAEGASGLPERGEARSEIIVYCPRGGTCAVQLVLATDGDQPPIDLCVRGLDAMGARAEVFVEWFHKIKGKLLPDALIPLGQGGAKFGPLEFAGAHTGQRARAAWIDLHVPYGAQPGEYDITITALGRAFTARVCVLNFSLPERPAFTADMNSYADSLTPLYKALIDDGARYENGAFARVDRATHKLVCRHRVSMHNLPYDHSGQVIPSFAPALAGEGKRMRVSDWSAYDAHFGPMLSGDPEFGPPIPYMYLPFNFDWPSSYEKWGTKGYETENRRVLKDFIAHFEEKGWTHTTFEIFLNHKKRYRFFPYDGDEARYGKDDVIFDLYIRMFGDMLKHDTVKVLLRTDSSWRYGRHFDSRYADHIEMWVVNGGIYDWYPEAVERMRARGNILFSYSQLPSIAEPLVNTLMRVLRPLMTGQMGVTFWNSTDCGSNWRETPVNDGAVCCMYPGEAFGLQAPIPSIRLKLLRDALGLCEYLFSRGCAQALVNAVLGFAPGDWWCEKPPFEKDDPCTWTGARLSDAKPQATLREPPRDLHTRLINELLKAGEA